MVNLDRKSKAPVSSGEKEKKTYTHTQTHTHIDETKLSIQTDISEQIRVK